MIICDTGPIFAAADRRDADHHACVELFTGLRLAGLGVDEIATLDHRHFRVVRPRHVQVLTLLPELAS